MSVLKKSFVLPLLWMVVIVGQSVYSQSLSKTEQEHMAWIDSVLRSIHTVKVGMTRADLMKVFTTEGGISDAMQRTYIYRGCGYIKVDVKFAATGPFDERPDDRILEISRPYLDWAVSD